MEGMLIVEEEPGVDIPWNISNLTTYYLNVLNMPFDQITDNPDWGIDGDLLKTQVLYTQTTSEVYNDSTNGVYGNPVVDHRKNPDIWGMVLTVNGHVHPVIDLVRGSWTRLRLLYASASYWLDLIVLKENERVYRRRTTLECQLRLIGKDGIYVHNPPRRYGVTMLFPGTRSDILIKCEKVGKYWWTYTNVTSPSSGGTHINPTDYVSHSLGVRDSPSFEQRMVMFNVVDPEPDDVVVSELPKWTPKYPCYLRDLRDDNVTEENSIKLQMVSDKYQQESLEANNQSGRGAYKNIAGSFRINKDSFDVEDPLANVTLNEIIEFNMSIIWQHPVHTHVNPYQLVGSGNVIGCLGHPPFGPHCRDQYRTMAYTNPDVYNGDEALGEGTAGDYYGYMVYGDWHDTLILNQLFALTRMQLAQFDGRMVIHCHNLAHEDWGMMTYIDIVNTSGSTYCHDFTNYSHDKCWCPGYKPIPAFELTGTTFSPYAVEEQHIMHIISSLLSFKNGLITGIILATIAISVALFMYVRRGRLRGNYVPVADEAASYSSMSSTAPATTSVELGSTT